jgi:hypothetical protein
MKMQLLRRNNLNPIPGARHQTSAFYGDRGWKPRKSSPPPVEGELFSLTFPFIDQALALKTPSMSVIAILQQLPKLLMLAAI